MGLPLRTLTAVIAEALGLPEDRITDDLAFQAVPEWDSLAHVTLILALESHLDLEIDGDQMVQLINVAAIRRFASDLAAP